MEVKCSATLNYTVDHAPDIPIVHTHLVPAVWTEPTYPMSALTYQQPLCKAIKFEFLDSIGGTAITAGLTSKTTPDGTVDPNLDASPDIYAIPANWGVI